MCSDANNKQHEVWQLRKTYLDNGYPPVAINNGEKFPKEYRWQIHAFDRIPPAIRSLPDVNKLSTGIVCTGLLPIDIDVDNPDRNYRISEYFDATYGCAPMRWRTNSPRVLLLYDSERIRSKVALHNKATGDRIEFLGNGQQFFADGIHPSGVPLLWRDGSPSTVTRSDLITLTDEQVDKALAFCASVIGVAPKTTPTHTAPTEFPSVEGIDDVWLEADVRSALAVIVRGDNDERFRIGCAVYVASGGSQDGYQAYLDWCGTANENKAKELWKRLQRNKPERITAATLAYHAMAADPVWRKIRAEELPFDATKSKMEAMRERLMWQQQATRNRRSAKFKPSI
jgi:hypothetical protein